MLSKNKKNATEMNTTSDIRNYIQRHLEPVYTVEVPEQYPIQLGDKRLYSIRVVRTDDGQEKSAHVALDKDLDLSNGGAGAADLELVNIASPKNPFSTALGFKPFEA